MPSPSRSNDDSNDAEDGVMGRLAKTLFANPNRLVKILHLHALYCLRIRSRHMSRTIPCPSPFTAFADRQRVERIEQCKQLENIVVACQSAKHARDARKAGEELKETPDMAEEIPTSRSGARIARFFKWNNPPGYDAEQNGTQTAESSSVLDEAVSSFYDNGSGDDKARQGKKIAARPRFSEDCAIETHELWACRALALGCGNHLVDLRKCWSDQNSVATVTMRDEGIEFYKDPKEEKSCRSIQLSMARCVNRHTAELNERVKASQAGKQ
jgi:hypothetical protein